MSRFEQIWAGGSTARLSPLASPPTGPPDSTVAGPNAERFDRYVHDRLVGLAGAGTRLQLDRLKVRLCDRLVKELNAAGNRPERAAILETFAAALDAIAERALEVEPPDLVEHVPVREPAPDPLGPRQAMGLFYHGEAGE